MAIENAVSGVGSFQPRTQSSSSSGTDNRAVQFSLDSAPAAEAAAPQIILPSSTAAKINSYQQASALANDTSSSISASDTSTETVSAPRSEPGQNNVSALNYSASGAANSPSSASQAGRLVSLSV